MLPPAQYTDLSSVVALTDAPATGVALPATDPSQYGNRPQACLLQAEDQDIRWTNTGGDPSASFGMILAAGESFLYTQPQLNLLRFIEATAGATLNVVYYATVAEAVAEYVTSFNGRTGAVTLTQGDVDAALGYDAVRSVVAGSNVTVDDTDPRNPIVSASGGGGGGGIAVWDSGTTYSADALVLDRGGIWQATGTNTNSRPISGNTDWTLVGGEPYVDVSFTPDYMMQTGADTPRGANGLVVVPAPGANRVAIITAFSWTQSAGEAWEANYFPVLCYGSSGGPDLSTLLMLANVYYIEDTLNVSGDLPGWFYVKGMWPVDAYLLAIKESGANLTAVTNQPIVFGQAQDPSNGGLGYGTAYLSCRLWYAITPGPQTAPNYFHITDLDQGTKTFTVTGDASALTGSIEVVGSTANDGTYTVVSTSGTGPTDIIVTEAIPSATADGWVKQ